MDYDPPGARDAWDVLEQPELGYVSRYALGRDYHKVLRSRLQRLADRIAGHVGPFGYRAFVDSAPVLEKALARNAGLGWIGKHTNLLSNTAGSWFFLGELYTDLPLPVDTPATEHCGTCVRCIEICPTRAIVAPYQLDARRCISYLTIEHRGAIPRELRPLMGNLVFGCDICQDVCPWNKFAQVAPEREFYAREGNLTPSLIVLMGMTREEFNRRFKGSPVKRAKHAGFLRNVAVALGNSNDPAAIPALETALVHEEPLVRAHAAWALGRLGARAALERRRPVETEAEVIGEIDAALAAR
jgi:epoxyqueuosine reductase